MSSRTVVMLVVALFVSFMWLGWSVCWWADVLGSGC